MAAALIVVREALEAILTAIPRMRTILLCRQLSLVLASLSPECPCSLLVSWWEELRQPRQLRPGPPARRKLSHLPLVKPAAAKWVIEIRVKIRDLRHCDFPAVLIRPQGHVNKKVSSTEILHLHTPSYFIRFLFSYGILFFSSTSVQPLSLSSGYLLFFHFHLVRAWRLIFLLLRCVAFGKLIHTVQDTTNGLSNWIWCGRKEKKAKGIIR